MTATTFRADIGDLLVTILEEQKTATPDHLRKVERARPGSFGELPCAYVSSRSERITWNAGSRVRTMTGLTVTVVDAYRDNMQTGDLLDELVDYLVDRFNEHSNVQRLPGSKLELNSVTDADIDNTGPDRTVTYRGVVLGFDTTFKVEGRD